MGHNVQVAISERKLHSQSQLIVRLHVEVPGLWNDVTYLCDAVLVEKGHHTQGLEPCEFKSTGSIDTSVYIALYQGNRRLSNSLYTVPIEIVLPGFQPSMYSQEEIDRMEQNLHEALNRDLRKAQVAGLCKDLEPMPIHSSH